MMTNIIIFGAGGHSKVVLDAARCSGLSIYGLFDDNRELVEFEGYPVFHDMSALTECPRGVVAIGDNAVRARIVERIKCRHPQFEFVTVVHPDATIAAGVEVGAGTVAMAGSRVNPGCRLGEHCIVNTNASVDHDSKLLNFVNLSPGVTTGGNVVFVDSVFVGVGANFAPGITVGKGAVIGMGANVLKDVPEGVLAYGNPAQPIRRVV